MWYNSCCSVGLYDEEDILMTFGVCVERPSFMFGRKVYRLVLVNLGDVGKESGREVLAFMGCGQ